jgi:hypothetical protein
MNMSERGEVCYCLVLGVVEVQFCKVIEHL